MVARGDFRRDLYARVAGFTARLPRLQDRIDDLGLIVASLLQRIASPEVVLDPDVGRALIAYDWPLNIRELGQALAACVALAKGGPIEPQHLPPQLARALEAPPPAEDAAATAAADRNERLRLELLAKIAEHRGNLAEVARAMGKARMQVHRWCRRFGIEPDAFRS
jgi:transcriptional regulator of acetoin/glycerol metabolism